MIGRGVVSVCRLDCSNEITKALLTAETAEFAERTILSVLAGQFEYSCQRVFVTG